jgi:hypothetical protein
MRVQMQIKAILSIFTAARDRNGNCYHAAQYTDTATGVSIQFGNIGGASNMNALPGLLGYDWENVYLMHAVLPIRQWQRFTKAWPYIANHANETAVAAVKTALEGK